MTIGVVVLLLGAYSVRVLVKGRYVPERVKKEPGSVFLSRFFIEFGYWCFEPLEKLCLRLRVTPNQLTAGSLACSVGAAASFATGRFTLGGWLVIACAILDALDGMVARTRGIASDAGELLDAAVDRYAEIATFAGIAAYYRSYPLGFWLALTSLAGALLVSYARAKGEISGIDARMGSMNRGERAVYIGAAGVLSPYLARFSEPGVPHPAFYLMLATLLLVAVMANVTAIRRFIYIHTELRKREGAAETTGAREEELSGWFQRAWIASAVATAVDYGSFTILVEVVGIYTGSSRALGALLGAITNFTLNKIYTFRTRDNSVLVEVPRYAAISLTSLLLNTVGVILLTEGLRWNPLAAAAVVGLGVSLGWNLPLHRIFVFREHTVHRPVLALIGAVASGLAAMAVLFVSYGNPFAEEQVHGFSSALPDAANLTQKSFLPKLRSEAFYSESYSFLLTSDDGSFARVQFLVSNAGLEGHGKGAVRAVVVAPDGKTVEDGEAFESGEWGVQPEGAIEMGASRLTMGPDASQHVHFAGRKLVVDATVLPETRAVRPGGGRVVFDSGGHAVFDNTIFALRSRFEGTLWSVATGSRRTRGYCYADTSYSTVPAYKSASLWYRMQAFDGDGGTSAALAVLFPPEGSRLPPQGWLYTSRAGKTEVRSTDVKIAFEDFRHEPGGHFEYDVPQRVAAVARGVDGETVTLRADARKLLYRQDLLDEMSPLSRLLVSTWAAPMAYTYENRYELRIEKPGEAPALRSGQALSEFSYANKPTNLPAF
ncbi:MAG: hypothetical protein E6J65_22150 [Deltaproteobacteria bacterium]|nr:MAG: hypothetical protein E6J65_22150 [Deltaproteobacteria bacterium]